MVSFLVTCNTPALIRTIQMLDHRTHNRTLPIISAFPLTWHSAVKSQYALTRSRKETLISKEPSPITSRLTGAASSLVITGAAASSVIMGAAASSSVITGAAASSSGMTGAAASSSVITGAAASSSVITGAAASSSGMTGAVSSSSVIVSAAVSSSVIVASCPALTGASCPVLIASGAS
jgi:hypothetical protein